MAAALAATIFLLPSLVHIPYLSERGCCSRFDAEAWQALSLENADAVSCTRGRMVNDIKRRLTESKANRADVVRLLGKSESRSTICSDYWLGSCGHFLEVWYFDFDTLRVCFNQDNSIAYIEHRSH